MLLLILCGTPPLIVGHSLFKTNYDNKGLVVFQINIVTTFTFTFYPNRKKDFAMAEVKAALKAAKTAMKDSDWEEAAKHCKV